MVGCLELEGTSGVTHSPSGPGGEKVGLRQLDSGRSITPGWYSFPVYWAGWNLLSALFGLAGTFSQPLPLQTPGIDASRWAAVQGLSFHF